MAITLAVSPIDAINPICDAETGADTQHTLTVTVTGGQGDEGTYNLRATIVGPNAYVFPDRIVTLQQEPVEVVYDYPVAGRAKKGVDTITFQLYNDEGVAVSGVTVTATKTWEKALLYQQADGTYSTTPQSEEQSAGMTSNCIGQGCGIVTPHKDIVCLYPEYVIAAIDSLVASAISRASELGITGGTILKNYSSITKERNHPCDSRCPGAGTGLPLDISVPKGECSGETELFYIDDVKCVIGVVIDALIWYPVTGYNPQQGDFFRIMDKAGNSLIKWPLSSKNPQLRVPIVLRGHEIILETIDGANYSCEYGKYKLKVQLCVAASRDHLFRIEFGGVKVVTTDSQLSVCEEQQTQQSEEQCVETD